MKYVIGNLWKLGALVLLGTLILGAVFGLSFVGCDKENDKMDTTKDGFAPNLEIPAIDASVPVITETATFALG